MAKPATNSALGSTLDELFLQYSQAGFVFGCEQLGGYEWGELNLDDIERAILHAFNHNVKIFDTADCYGRGLSEERLGTILSPHRSNVCIATKYGVRFGSSGVFYDSSPEYATESLHSSLKRLNTDYIDLFQMHYWDGNTDLDDVIAQLEDFVSAGKIRAYGFTNIVNLPEKYCKSDSFRTISFEHSLANRSNELKAQELSKRGFTFLSYGSLGQGVLTGKYNKSAVFSEKDRRSRPEYKNFHGQRLEHNLGIVAVLEKWSQCLELSIPKLALSWICSVIPGSVPIVGFKNPVQLDGVLGFNEIVLPAEALKELDNASQYNE